MKGRDAIFYARHPVVAAHRVWRASYERRHPDHPWLAPGAIRFCERTLHAGMTGLEWGSGRSTTWFAQRIKHLTSVEHVPEWHARVAERVRAAALTNVDLRLIDMPSDPAELEALYWQGSAYVRVAEEFEDNSLDFVVVDGLFRQECIGRAVPKIASGGYLLVDDTKTLARLEDWGVPAGWPIAYRSRMPVAETTIWRKP
jgi:hypothetical protein